MFAFKIKTDFILTEKKCTLMVYTEHIQGIVLCDFVSLYLDLDTLYKSASTSSSTHIDARLIIA